MVEKDGAPKKRGRKPRAKKAVTPKVEEVKVEEVKVEEIVEEKPKQAPKKKPAKAPKDVKAEAVVKMQELKDWLDNAVKEDRSLALRLNPLSKDLFRAINKLK